MIDLVKSLFPNFCILVTLLFLVTSLVPQEPGQLTRHRKAVIVLSMAFIPVLLYQYSLPLEPGVRFDLRYVPIALATLWGGPQIGLLVALPLMVLRVVEMNSGTLSALISVAALLLLSTLTRPALNLSQRHSHLHWQDLPRVIQVFSLNAIGSLASPGGVDTFSRIYLPLLFMNVMGMYVASAVIQHRLGILNTFHTALAQSRLDALTGLANRRQFERDLEYLQPGDIVTMLDIDHFKRVNDVHGHVTGDAVLRAVGTSLGGTMRSTDSVYRFGGEEFVLIIRNALPHTAPQILERLRKQLAALSLKDPSLPDITVSLGAAIHARQSPQTTLQQADDALYQAKESGRNRGVVWPEDTTGPAPAGHLATPSPGRPRQELR